MNNTVLICLAALLYPVIVGSGEKPFHSIVSKIVSQSKLVGIEPELSLAIVKTESEFRPNAVRFEPKHQTHSVGMFQVFIPTARLMGFRGTVKDLMRPDTNIRYGTQYLAMCAERFEKPELIACCYNAGHNIEETVCNRSAQIKKYVKKVMHLYRRLKRPSAPPPARTRHSGEMIAQAVS